MSALVTYGRMIKVSHTIFSMPFALAAAVLAGREHSVTLTQIVLIVLCVLTARSSAMGSTGSWIASTMRKIRERRAVRFRPVRSLCAPPGALHSPVPFYLCFSLACWGNSRCCCRRRL